MGLKGYRVWVMGQLDSNVQSPTGAGGSTRDSSSSGAAADPGAGV
jgi:hypothetical protein